MLFRGPGDERGEEEERMAGRVAVIGAGPCGLAALRAFALAKEKGAEIQVGS